LVDGRRGERQVNDAEAAVVLRIFRDFAAGKSPRALAKVLNAERIPGPDGRQWRDTTIRGQIDRGTGILNNSLYVGRLEWNRCSYIKDPKTGKRVARPNAKEVWEVVQVPALRLIDDDLWDAVRRRQQSLSFAIQRDDAGNALNRAHRRKFLLSGLLKCGCCGGGFTIVGQDRYGCATHRTKGTCANSATIRRQEIETRVLAGLKDRLMAPELVREFIRAFHDEVNRAAAERERKIKSDALELQSLEKKIASIVAAIEEGKYSRALSDRLSELERQRDLILARKVESPTATIRVHPRLADAYAEKVQQLEAALNEPSIREEAAEVFRSLVDRVELRPRDKDRGLEALLYGDLIEILGFCGKDAQGRSSTSQLSVVAGTRNHLYRTKFFWGSRPRYRGIAQCSPWSR